MPHESWCDWPSGPCDCGAIPHWPDTIDYTKDYEKTRKLRKRRSAAAKKGWKTRRKRAKEQEKQNAKQTSNR